MPELLDVNVYVETIAARTVGHELRGVRLKSSFLLRTFDPLFSVARARKVAELWTISSRHPHPKTRLSFTEILAQSCPAHDPAKWTSGSP